MNMVGHEDPGMKFYLELAGALFQTMCVRGKGVIWAESSLAVIAPLDNVLGMPGRHSLGRRAINHP